MNESAQTTSQRPCFVCSHNHVFLIKKLGYSLFDNSPLSKEVTLVACCNCGAVFYDFASTQADYDKYYRENTVYNAPGKLGSGEPMDCESNRYRDIEKILHFFIPQKDKLIADIGCAKGGCLRVLQSLQWENIVGIDPLVDNITALNSQGVTAYQGTAANIPLPSDSCGGVILSHILEHIVAMPDILTEMARILSKDGILYAEVPNGAKYPSFSKAPCWDFLYEHVNHFDLEILNNLMKYNGFSLVSSGESCIGDKKFKFDCVYGVFKKIDKQEQPVETFNLYNHIGSFLSDSGDHIEIELDKIPSTDKKIYIWGISSYAMQVVYILQQKKSNVHLEIIDSCEQKQRRTLSGLRITPPPNTPGVLSNDSVMIIAAGPHESEIANCLTKINYTGRIVII